MPSPTSRQILIAGAAFIMLGEAFLAIMGAVIKHLAEDLSNEQIVFFRNLAGLIMLLPILSRTGISELRTQNFRLHLLRALVGLSAMYCYFYVLGHIPLAEALLVKLTSPFFMPLIAWLWLREPAGANTRLAIIIGFTGVAFILRPGSEHYTVIALIGLAGAALAALAKVVIRRMGPTESSVSIVFYFAVISALISAPPALLNWKPVPDAAWGFIVLMGAVATLGQLALTRAYRTAPTAKVGVYVYVSIIYGALLGWVFWGEIPPWSTWVGTALIIFAGLLNLKPSTKTEKNRSNGL